MYREEYVGLFCSIQIAYKWSFKFVFCTNTAMLITVVCIYVVYVQKVTNTFYYVRYMRKEFQASKSVKFLTFFIVFGAAVLKYFVSLRFPRLFLAKNNLQSFEIKKTLRK